MKHILVEEAYRNRTCVALDFGSGLNLPDGNDIWPVSYLQNKPVYQIDDLSYFSYQEYKVLEYNRTTGIFTVVVSQNISPIIYAVPAKGNYILCFFNDGSYLIWDRCSNSFVNTNKIYYRTGVNPSVGPNCSFYKLDDRVYILNTDSKSIKSVSLKSFKMSSEVPLSGYNLNINFLKHTSGVEYNGKCYFLDADGYLVDLDKNLNLNLSLFNVIGNYNQTKPSNLSILNNKIYFGVVSDYHHTFFNQNAFITEYNIETGDIKRIDSGNLELSNNAFIIENLNYTSLNNSYNNGVMKSLPLGEDIPALEPLFSGFTFVYGSTSITFNNFYFLHDQLSGILVGNLYYYIVASKLDSLTNKKQFYIKYFNLENYQQGLVSSVPLPIDLNRPVYPDLPKLSLSYIEPENSLGIYISQYNSLVDDNGLCYELRYNLSTNSYSSLIEIGSFSYTIANPLYTSNGTRILSQPSYTYYSDSFFKSLSVSNVWVQDTSNDFDTIIRVSGNNLTKHYFVPSTKNNYNLRYYDQSLDTFSEVENSSYYGYLGFINYNRLCSNIKSCSFEDKIYFTLGNSSVLSGASANNYYTKDLNYLIVFDTNDNSFSLKSVSDSPCSASGGYGKFSTGNSNNLRTYYSPPIYQYYRKLNGDEVYFASTFSGLLRVLSVEDYEETYFDLPMDENYYYAGFALTKDVVPLNQRCHFSNDTDFCILGTSGNLYQYDKSKEKWFMSNIIDYKKLASVPYDIDSYEIWNVFESNATECSRTTFKGVTHTNKVPLLTNGYGQKGWYITPNTNYIINSFDTNEYYQIPNDSNIHTYRSVYNSVDNCIYFLGYSSTLNIENSNAPFYPSKSYKFCGWDIYKFDLFTKNFTKCNSIARTDNLFPRSVSISISNNIIYILQSSTLVITYDVLNDLWGEKVIPCSTGVSMFNYYTNKDSQQFASFTYENLGELNCIIFDRFSYELTGSSWSSTAFRENKPYKKVTLQDYNTYSYDNLAFFAGDNDNTEGIFSLHSKRNDKLDIIVEKGQQSVTFDTISEKWAISSVPLPYLRELTYIPNCNNEPEIIFYDRLYTKNVYKIVDKNNAKYDFQTLCHLPSLGGGGGTLSHPIKIYKDLYGNNIVIRVTYYNFGNGIYPYYIYIDKFDSNFNFVSNLFTDNINDPSAYADVSIKISEVCYNYDNLDLSYIICTKYYSSAAQQTYTRNSYMLEINSALNSVNSTYIGNNILARYSDIDYHNGNVYITSALLTVDVGKLNIYKFNVNTKLIDPQVLVTDNTFINSYFDFAQSIIRGNIFTKYYQKNGLLKMVLVPRIGYQSYVPIDLIEGKFCHIGNIIPKN